MTLARDIADNAGGTIELFSSQTGSYTAVLADAGKTVTMTSSSATTFTIPSNSVAFPVGTPIQILNLGSGACTPTAGAGVTINGTITALATNASASLIKTATNTWSYMPSGGFAASATATVATTQTTTSSSYTDLATAGPEVTVTTGTKAFVITSARMSGSALGFDSYQSYAVSGATTVAASDTVAIMHGTFRANTSMRASAGQMITGLTAGANVFTCKYRVDATSTGTFLDRAITVIDMGS